MSYGTLPLPGGAGRRATRPSQRALAIAAIAAGALCIMAIAFTAGKRSDNAELLFKTPKLKDLLGTFMKNQGASSKDIREMDSYYKGASMKARTQMLDDLSGEFDPISDADSNYGRVIGIKVASRTNPAIAEDMDVSADKAPVEMLYDVDGPQPTDPSYASLRKSAVRHAARGPSGQDKLRMMIQQGILGTADKAPTQMLAEERQPVNVWQQIGAEEPSKAATQVMKQNDDTGYKARTQMLDDISGEFDPISDADSNYGRVIGIKVASRTNPAIAEDMDVSADKAPTQMLAEERQPVNVWQQIGAEEPSKAATQVMKQNDDTGYKARTQMLDDISGEFDPISDADSNYGRVIGIKVASRTNPAIAEDMDVSADKAPTQMLAEERQPVNVWQQIGAEEPSKAATQVMKQNDDTGYKARTQMLDDISGEFDPISDADSNYGRVIGIKVASRTNPAIAEDMDVSADKAPTQMLAEERQPVNVWQQIGAEEPSKAATQVMKQNDDTGYKARTQMLDDISGEFDPISDADSNYGRVIGIKVASRTNPAIAEDMDVSADKAPTQMLAEERQPVNVWQQIGAEEPSKAATQVMKQNDDTGYKARTQMLDDISGEFDPISDADSNYGRVIGIKVASRTNPAIAEDMDVSADKAPTQMLAEERQPVNVWQQIGAEEPSKAATQVMKQNDDTGYKARTQMLDDISGEFDPISDADSNYGRVIGIKVASRTNPAIAEDMDVSADKAPVEMLYDVDGPQPTDGSRSSWKQAAKYDQDSRQGSTLAQEILAAEPPH